MTHRTAFFLAIAVLAFAAGMSQRVCAQVYDKTYAKSLILAGNGTDAVNTLTISAPTSSASLPIMLPAANAAGVLQITNTTNGTCAWTIPTPINELAPGPDNTFAITNSSSAVTWAAIATDASISGNGLTTNLALALTHSNTWTTAQTIQIASTGTTDALELENTTTAASGAANQEYSPRLHLNGQGWGGSNQSVDWIMQAVPVTSSTSPTSSYLDFEDQVNGAGYANDLDLFASGGATLGIASPTDPGAGILNVGTGFQIGGLGTNGKVLVGNSAGTAYVISTVSYPTTTGGTGNVIWSNSTGGFTAAAPYTNQWTIGTNPAGTSNTTTGVMMGMGSTAQFTPAGSGVVLIIITGNMALLPTTNNYGVAAQIHYGPTGTNYPPANGYSATGTYSGTAVGSDIQTTMANGENVWFFSCNAIVTGLTIGNTYWIDAAVKQPVTGSTVDAEITDVVISVVELE